MCIVVICRTPILPEIVDKITAAIKMFTVSEFSMFFFPSGSPRVVPCVWLRSDLLSDDSLLSSNSIWIASGATTYLYIYILQWTPPYEAQCSLPFRHAFSLHCFSFVSDLFHQTEHNNFFNYTFLLFCSFCSFCSCSIQQNN